MTKLFSRLRRVRWQSFVTVFALGVLFVGINSLGSFALQEKNNNNQKTQSAVEIGTVENVDLQMQYTEGIMGEWEQTITYPEAEYIKVHFAKLDLVEGDSVTVANPAKTEIYTYPGSESTTGEEEGFWAMSITGDTAIITLHTQSNESQGSENLGIIIDKYTRGYPDSELAEPLRAAEMQAESTCGSNERTDVACYESSHPTEFKKANAVARLLINGRWLCTGWRVSPDNFLFTNEHCVTSQSAIENTEVWFNYQRSACGGGSVGSVTKVTGKDLIIDDATRDFALFTVNNFDSISDFGYLELDVRSPIQDEEIYIPQHGAGNPKEFGINSDRNTGNICRIDAVSRNGYGAGTDTGYYCDTTGGSSGSPVLARSSHKVIGLHHWGGCFNQGVRVDQIWPLVEPYLSSPSQGLLAHYDFEDSNLAKDATDNGYDGTVSGVTSASGVKGKAARFDGNDKIIVDAFKNLNWGDEFSVSVWFNRQGQLGNYQGIVNNGYYTNGSWEIRMGREDSGTMLGGGVITLANNQAWDHVNLSALTNNWHHVVMAYDGENLYYYLDNVLQGTTTRDNGALLVKNTPLTIGQAGVGKDNEYFYGLIDEVRVYNQKLSADEVQVLYEDVDNSQGLLAHYDFEDSNLAKDATDNGYDGTVSGVTSASGVKGKAARFDGNDKIIVDAFKNLNWGDEFSVSVWFNRQGQLGNYQGIVNNGYYTNGSWEIRMGREDSGTMLGGGVITLANNQAWDHVNLSALTNNWHHVVMAYDGENLYYYLDNVLQGTTTRDNGALLVKNTPLTIGQAGVGKDNEYFYGLIDEVRVYNQKLSADEVQVLYEDVDGL